MTRKANVFARVEPELKEQAELILNKLGIPMSNAVGMFLKQIVLQSKIYPRKWTRQDEGIHHYILA